jgi:hypothetical protein
MELIVFLAVGAAIIYVLYKVYGPKSEQAPTPTVADVVAKAETIVAEAKTAPAKKAPAKKKPTVKKATTRKPKATK